MKNVIYIKYIPFTRIVMCDLYSQKFTEIVVKLLCKIKSRPISSANPNFSYLRIFIFIRFLTCLILTFITQQTNYRYCA
jgi:hypothetical protein